MRARVIFAGVLLLLITFVIVLLRSHEELEPQELSVLPKRTDAGFVTSDACVSCHPDQHASWHKSFHHTMTQPANTETVLAPFDDVQLETDGQTARLTRRGEEFWVNTVDQAWEKEKFAQWTASRASGGPDPYENLDSEPPRVDAQVVMTTGSHHFQAYWIRGQQGQELWQFPWRYHIAEQRWVHRKDVFLAPPEWRPGMWFRVWNSQCIYCHSTGPYPGENRETAVMTDTKIAELGISCEACHGPAEQHVKLHNGSHPADEQAPDSIVNPAKLPHQKSAQVCGACHSHFNHSDPLLSVHGPQFRPGGNLYHHGSLIDPPSQPVTMTRFWGDGTNRSGGREFSGMSQSECYRQGELACVSCHSMHESDPNDQLSAVGIGSEACLQCHAEYRDSERLTQHTHHAEDSTGSQCYNCHMPHTNYALFKAIRSHQIDIPKVVSLASNTRPNACNLCHLDQTLQWTADHLDAWYSLKSPALTFDDKYLSAGVLWALKGDAGQRVIAAWHFGWAPARMASGDDWMIPTITQLMRDPYAAVRWVAFDALRKDEIFADVKYDFDGGLEDRDAVADQVLADWAAKRSAVKPDERWPRLLLDGKGLPEFEQIQRILADRDNRMVAGVE